MNQRCLISVLTISLFVFVSGCTQEPQIESHRIHKDRSGLEKLRQSETLTQFDSATRTPAEKTRMAVAIFQNPEATWFFKVSGPAEQVTKSEEQWKSFFKTVKFEKNEPSWDMPEDWSQSGPKPMRHSTLIIGQSEPPLEMAISSLGPDQDLLLNVNRWRGQIGLDPTSQDELDGEIEKLETESEKYLLFDATGTGSGAMSPPFAGGAPFAGAPFAGTTPGNGSAPLVDGLKTGSTKLAYEAPEGWSEGKTSSIVHARLTKTVESAEAQITIVEMPADANEWEPNVKRWADQVGMGASSDDELAKRISDLTIDGVEGKSVDLVDLESDSPNGTIAGMVKRDGSAWFLKLTGDKKLVLESREVYEKFLDSLRFN